jgi:hypothetical protein
MRSEGRAVDVAMTRPPSFIDILRNPDTLTAVVASIDAGTRMPATRTSRDQRRRRGSDGRSRCCRGRGRDGRTRVRGLGDMVRRTAEQGPPRPELGQDEALDILHLLSKSGVIDAIGLPQTGTIARLSGTGTGALSVQKHGPHVHRRDDPGVTASRRGRIRSPTGNVGSRCACDG